MTKKLEDILNLPNVKEAFKQVDKKEQARENKDNTRQVQKNVDPKTAKSLQAAYDEFDKIEKALPQVAGLGELSDLELDKLAMEAEDSYKNLMDLGMNIEPRLAGRIMEVASSMMQNAINAKNSKVDKKLKMIELQLKKEKLDQGKPEEEAITGTGSVVADRNELIKQILANKPQDVDKDK